MSTFDSVFFPYRYDAEGIELQLDAVHLDGVAKDADIRSGTGTCVLTDLGAWSDARLQFRIGAQSGLVGGFVPSSEQAAPPVRAVLTVSCSVTKRRWAVPVDWPHVHGAGRVEVALTRGDVKGTVDVRLHIVRIVDQQEDTSLASDMAARVVSSRVWWIVVDEPARQPGIGLEPEWVDFAASPNPFLNQHPQLLSYIDFDTGEPRLLLNSGCDPDIRAVLVHQAPHGRKAWLRDTIYAAIAIPAWVTLVYEANRTAPAEEDNTVAPGWQRDVLATMAAVARPDYSTDEAITALRNELSDEEGGASIHSRLPGLAALMPEISFHTRLERLPGVMTSG